MKKKLLLGCVVFLMAALGLVACGGGNDAATDDKETLIVGVDDAYPPMTYRDEKTNEIIGFDVDMGNEFAKRIGVEFEWQPIEWKGVVQSLKTKKIDLVICGLTVTEERGEQINFSEPYMDAGISIAVKSGEKGFDTVESISDARLGVQTGSSGAQALIELGLEENVSYYDAYPSAFNDLSIGRIDAVIVDTVVGGYFIQQKPEEYQLHSNAVILEEYAVGIRKEDTKLQKKINDALDEMKADGTLLEIATKWFGAETAKEIIPE